MPICCCGLVIYGMCFGASAIFKLFGCFSRSASIAVDDNDFQPSGLRGSHRNNQMYVLPPDTVPAVVSSQPVPTSFQTGVIVNPSTGNIASEMHVMHTGAAGGDEVHKEIPTAYAQAIF